jgi:hypothetical protein
VPSATQLPDLDKIKNKLTLSRFLVSSFLAGLGGNTFKEKQAIIKAIGAVRHQVDTCLSQADRLGVKAILYPSGTVRSADETTAFMWKHMIAEAGHQDRACLSGMLASRPEALAVKTRDFTAGTPRRYLGEAVSILSAAEKDEVKRLLNEN